MKTALITGASGGIGLELARLFARDHYNLVVVARKTEKLEELKRELTAAHGIQVHVLTVDLALPDSAMIVFNQLNRENLIPDCLINNAGFGDFGFFWETNWQKTAEMIQLNITTLTQLTRLILPQMLKNKNGRIMNIASTAGFLPGPLMAVYYATKAYVLSFTEALANELNGTGVQICAFCPGPTTTGFQEAAGMSGARLKRLKAMMPAAAAAHYGYHSMFKGKSIILPGFFNKLTPVMVRLFPRKIMTQMIRSLSGK
jgi:uncharacterized protein